MTVPAGRRLRLETSVPDTVNTGWMKVKVSIQPLPAEAPEYCAERRGGEGSPSEHSAERHSREGSPPEHSAERRGGEVPPPLELGECLRRCQALLSGDRGAEPRPRFSAREAIERLAGISKDQPGTVDEFLLRCRIEKEEELARENPSVEDEYYAALARRGLSS